MLNNVRYRIISRRVLTHPRLAAESTRCALIALSTSLWVCTAMAERTDRLEYFVMPPVMLRTDIQQTKEDRRLGSMRWVTPVPEQHSGGGGALHTSLWIVPQSWTSPLATCGTSRHWLDMARSCRCAATEPVEQAAAPPVQGFRPASTPGPWFVLLSSGHLVRPPPVVIKGEGNAPAGRVQHWWRGVAGA